jgi:hypothetical protein
MKKIVVRRTPVPNQIETLKVLADGRWYTREDLGKRRGRSPFTPHRLMAVGYVNCGELADGTLIFQITAPGQRALAKATKR